MQCWLNKNRQNLHKYINTEFRENIFQLQYEKNSVTHFCPSFQFTIESKNMIL
jgi:hypothetical protein